MSGCQDVRVSGCQGVRMARMLTYLTFHSYESSVDVDEHNSVVVLGILDDS